MVAPSSPGSAPDPLMVVPPPEVQLEIAREIIFRLDLAKDRRRLSAKEVELREKLAARIPALLERVSGLCGAPSTLQVNPPLVIGHRTLATCGSPANQRKQCLARKANGRSSSLVTKARVPDATPTRALVHPSGRVVSSAASATMCKQVVSRRFSILAITSLCIIAGPP
ncbi:hypothetical protein ACP4OV_030428 [Aristida adscensionis]